MALLRSRPWTVHVFAAVFLAIGLHNLIAGLGVIGGWLATYRAALPQFPWNEDWVIVALSARFTIICIPVLAIWGWRKRVARTIVSAFAAIAGIGLLRVLGQSVEVALDWETIGKTLALCMACGLLFLPSASRWLAHEEEANDAEMFE